MLFVAICCSACNGNITRDIRHGGYSIAGEFKCSAFYPKNKDDTNYEKIKYFLGSYAITEKGKIYEGRTRKNPNPNSTNGKAKTSSGKGGPAKNRGKGGPPGPPPPPPGGPPPPPQTAPSSP